MNTKTSSDPLLIGIDVGTTNIKALIFDPRGHEIARAQAKTPTHHPQLEWAYYKPDELWETVCGVLKNAIAQIDNPANITGIATASIGETGVPIDKRGNPTGHAIAWFDQRTRPQCEQLRKTFDRDKLFSLTGLPLQPISSLCKILWIREHQPEAFARTATWLNTADYIAFRLSGIPATDYSLASRTLAFDLHRRQWANDLLSEVRLSPKLFAPLCNAGTDLGPILPDIARETGLPRHTRICAGGHDHICGALAVGVTEPGTMLNSLGTAEALCLPISHPLTDPQIGRQNFTIGAHVAPDQYYFLGGLFTSGASIEWFRSLFGEGADYTTLISEARESPPGSLGVGFLPQLRFTNPPHTEAIARGTFIGLTPDANRGTLFRAILEGLSMEMRLMIEASKSIPAYPKQKILSQSAVAYATNSSCKSKPLFSINPSPSPKWMKQRLWARQCSRDWAQVFTQMSAMPCIRLTPPCRPFTPYPNRSRITTQSTTAYTRQIYPAVQDLHHQIDQIQMTMVR